MSFFLGTLILYEHMMEVLCKQCERFMKSPFHYDFQYLSTCDRLFFIHDHTF